MLSIDDKMKSIQTDTFQANYTDFLDACSTLLYAGHLSWLLHETAADPQNAIKTAIIKSFLMGKLFAKDNQLLLPIKSHTSEARLFYNNAQ